MDTNRQQELEDLLALIESPGWARFKAMIEDDWSTKAYRRKSQAIIQRLSADDRMDQAATHLLQLESCATAIEGMFDRLRDRVKLLRHEAAGEVTR
jgi:hypothetical protein